MEVTEWKKIFKLCRIEDVNEWKVELVNVKQGAMFVEDEDTNR